MASLLTHICVTRLQWVKHLASYIRLTHILSLFNCNACLYLCIYDTIWLMLLLCLMVAICSLCVLRRGSYWHSTQFICFHQRTYLQINVILLALCFLCINIFEANNFLNEFMKYTTQSSPWHLKFSEAVRATNILKNPQDGKVLRMLYSAGRNYLSNPKLHPYNR